MNKHEDKIEHLIANEARQKRLAVVAAGLFTLGAIAIIVLSIRMTVLQQENRTLVVDKMQLQRENKLKDSIIGLQAALFRRFQDSVTQKRLMAIRDRAGAARGNKGRYTLYIQYAGDSKACLQQLQDTLSKEPVYKVPPAERITGQEFTSSVRYFDTQDEAAARRLAALAGAQCGMAFAVQHVLLKAPAQQLEIWIGKR